MKHPTLSNQRCRVIKTSSPRGLAVGLEVFTRWPHTEELRLDKVENGKVVGQENLGKVWRVQGPGLVNIPKHPGQMGKVPADQADFPAVWLEVIEEPKAQKSNQEHKELSHDR